MKTEKTKSASRRATAPETRQSARKTSGASVGKPRHSWSVRVHSLVGASLLVVMVAVALIWGLLVKNAQAAPQATSDPLATLTQFNDTVAATSFIVQTGMGLPDTGVFTFVTPTGAQYHGGTASDLQPANEGKLNLLYDGTAQLIVAQAGGVNPTSTNVAVHVHATIDMPHMQAQAELTNKGNGQHFVMSTSIPDGRRDAVNAFNQAMLHQDWAALYVLSSQTITGSFTQAEFVQLMTQQAQSVGTVTAILLTSEPKVSVDQNGTTTFSVTENITSTVNGSAQIQATTVFFVLEGGAWKFWYTA